MSEMIKKKSKTSTNDGHSRKKKKSSTSTESAVKTDTKRTKKTVCKKIVSIVAL
jgi:hypothetical protein